MYITKYMYVQVVCFNQVANVLVNGVPNREFPKNYEVDLNSWTMGALEAVSSVTK